MNLVTMNVNNVPIFHGVASFDFIANRDSTKFIVKMLSVIRFIVYIDTGRDQIITVDEFHPNPTSRHIMTMKPTMVVTEARRPLGPDAVSLKWGKRKERERKRKNEMSILLKGIPELNTQKC